MRLAPSSWSLLACILLAGGPAAAEGPKFTVEGISFKLWDEAAGKMVAFDKAPNPYGLNLTLMIVVKIKGPTRTEGSEPLLKLEAAAPARSDEATGSHPPWKLSQSRALTPVGDKGISYVLFVAPYECVTSATFTASVGASSKKVKQDLPCAE